MSQAGYVALLGRPNVGKSTLLNRLIAQKISITSPKPQTTRHAILGIKTLDQVQIVYVDTPGLHRHAPRAINRYMNRAASDTLSYVDVAVMVVAALRWTAEDEAVLQRLADFPGPVLLAINKVDLVKAKEQLLPVMQTLAERRQFAQILPMSALQGDNLEALESCIVEHLPESEFLFAEDQVTTLSQRFMAAEVIREKLVRQLRDELPYALTVDIERYEEQKNVVRIGAVIWVERPGQKAIVIGTKGQTLKTVGQQARLDMQTLFAKKVYLETWVRVRSGWSDDERALQQLGYQNNG